MRDPLTSQSYVVQVDWKMNTTISSGGPAGAVEWNVNKGIIYPTAGATVEALRADWMLAVTRLSNVIDGGLRLRLQSALRALMRQK